MKKLKGIVAALLSVSVIASGAALTACGGNDDGEGGSNVKPIDEQTWKAAFEELDYTNFSFRSNTGIEAMIGENVVYCKLQRDDEYLNEYYSVKNEDGTSVTYRKTYMKNNNMPDDSTINDAQYFIDFSTTFEQAVASAKAMVTLEVSYEDYYNSFTYNESKQEYVYNGVIAVSDTYKNVEDGIDDTQTFYFVDHNLKISNNKIVSYSSRLNGYSCECRCDLNKQPDHSETDAEYDMSLEYYNIGTTSVTVPPEVIAEATANSPID